jgi:hypothetical protein
VINLKLLSAPQLKPIDKDAVIDDLKRKLLATENQRDTYKQNWQWSAEREFKYFNKLTEIGVELDDN